MNDKQGSSTIKVTDIGGAIVVDDDKSAMHNYGAKLIYQDGSVTLFPDRDSNYGIVFPSEDLPSIRDVIEKLMCELTAVHPYADDADK